MALMEKAIEADEENVQALQTMATICMSALEPQRAAELLERSMSLWFIATPADEEAGISGYDPEQLPPLEFRINTAKLLLELHQCELAVDLLSQLLVEDNQLAQVWYLLGWAQHLGGEPEEAQVNLIKARELYDKTDAERPEMRAHIEEILEKYARGDTAVVYEEQQEEA